MHLVLLILALFVGGEASAKVFYTQQEAMALAFPDADRIESRTHILSESEVSIIQSISRSQVSTRLVTIHKGWRGDDLLGYAHIDVHTVRTKPEGFMVVLRPDGVVRAVRVLAFHEPLEYMPARRWYARFIGKTRSDGIRVGRDVDAVTGATLTTRAAADGVRRMLAYYEVLLGD
ncbi:MAG: FMN-binding protein [Deltaproteobacteria bacterium]|jgi:transcriptional regulator of nitric oxide reductase|nr:FMN-binding protein [Deltaproteobacteria bacterium]